MAKNETLLVGTVVCWVVFAVGCGHPPTTGPSDAKLTADGPTVQMTLLKGEPLYSLEVVGDVRPNNFAIPIDVPHSSQFVVTGWAVDGTAQSAAGGVDVVIDGKAYAASYGSPRSDVADHFKIPEYLASGFRFSAAGEAFATGSHKMVIRVLNNGKTGYFEGTQITIRLQ